MLQINGKNFLNLQEAVQWLLDNNALPFQSSANYVANTEIGMGTIVNPSPAKVRIGSLIFFADSKVSTVTGLTENGFIVSDQYNDLVDDVVYVSNVALNASGHLIVTLSNGNTIDAGLIKQVSNFNINASQHLIANYNDGTTEDLGAIFTGNITISGSLQANTVKQTSYNYESNNLNLAASFLNGLTLIDSYAKFVEINNVLYIIISAEVQNETASDIATGTGQITPSQAIPNSIANKIIRKDGVNCGLAYSTTPIVLPIELMFAKDNLGGSFDKIKGSAQSVYANSLYLTAEASYTVPAGEKRYIDFRTFLIL